jgi:hypothetical protein
MRKIAVGLICAFTVGVATAQMATYLDSQGRPFMYSSKVGTQVTYFDNTGKPVAYMFNPVVSGPHIESTNTPPLVYPMISSSLPGSPSLPSLPELPTLKGF